LILDTACRNSSIQRDGTGSGTKQNGITNLAKLNTIPATTTHDIISISEVGTGQTENAELIRDVYVSVYTLKCARLTCIPRFALFSVHFFLDLAKKELQAQNKELSISIAGTSEAMKRYREREKICFENYVEIYKDITPYNKSMLGMNRMARPVRDTFQSVRSDIDLLTSRVCHFHDTWNVLQQKYWEAGHHGVICVLETIRLLKFKPYTSPESASRFIQSRREFLRQCVTISNRYDFKSSHTHSILRSQIFLPKELLRLPTIWDEVRKDKRRDLLGRSAWCMGHDAGLRARWPDAYLGDVDLVGRSVWYLACTRNDAALLDQLLDTHPTPWRIEGSSLCPSGLIHAAALKGYTAIFKTLQRTFPYSFRESIIAITDEKGLNCLHVAARTGHQSTVEYLCQHLTAQFVNRRRCKEGRTALHLAAMGGHVEVMDCLMRASEEDHFSNPGDSKYRSVFWWAAWAGSVDALKLFEARCKQNSTAGVDDRDVLGNTPFAIAIINSNFDAARYLLSLNTSKNVRVDVNRVNVDCQAPLDHLNEEWDARGCDDKELKEDDRELEDIIALLKAHGALTYDEMQEQEMQSDEEEEEEEEEEEDTESEFDKEEAEDLIEDEQMDVDSEEMMAVEFDFDSFFAQVSILSH
jgi:ankyrin repeat protein